MLFQSNFVVLALFFVSSAPVAFGRELILERDGRPFYLYRRRFSQENPATLNDIRASCSGGLCDTIAGKAVSALLAGADPCAQQAISEELIDSSSQFDQATADKMIAAAVAFRQAEKNTPPDFTQNPPALRNSVFCLTPPKFPQLEGLNQAQDPSNDPNLFFDPTTKTTVLKGSQANTSPLSSNGQVSGNGAVATPSSTAIASGATPTAKGGVGEVAVAAPPAPSCPAAVTVTVSGTAIATPTEPAVTVTVGGSSAATATATSTAGNAGGSTGSTGTSTGTDQTGGAGSTAPAGTGAADFGICTTPEIVFGVGFDNRKETSFEPKDLVSYAHGSAQNINIITQFICDTLTNKCKANQAAKDLCAQAQAAAAAGTPKTGQQADIFNNVFGIKTDFASVPSVDDQGRVVAGTGSASGSVPAGNANTGAASSGTTSTGASNTGTTTTSTSSQAGSTGSGTNTNTGANTANTGANSGNTNNRSANTASNPSPPAVSQPAANSKGTAATSSNAGTTATNNAANLQTFSGDLGAAAPVVTDLGNGKFETNGNQFNSLNSAIERSCAVQNNQCANAANSSGNKNGLTVADCNKQQASCNGQAGGN
ncbi:hypothetical protein CPB83DRAFT_804757 [Crepidotus variabilis]|uniref:Uncharacterized protein n=1 Tax=Crepidotus variabilis TaxID=179855 RepID=A0A9P6ES27_9AGAR|nr:hypothetical protein CPB83DRAFT_804757 [Crepidotus variabilis]